MSIASNPINFDHPEISSPEQNHNVKRMSHKEAMILKLTHPPTNVPELEGLPTNDARTQVVINHRNVDVLKEPNVIRQDGTIGIVPWQRVPDMGLIIPTGARIQYIGAVYSDDAPSAFVQDIANTKIQDNFNFDNWQNTVNLYRPIYKSTSLYANVTAFNNQGIIACQQFNPNIMFAGKILEMSWNAPDLFRKYVVKLITMDPTIAVNGDHDLDFNPAPIDAAMKELSLRGKTVRLDPNTSIQLINMREIGYEQDSFSLVPTPSQIMTNSLRAYGGKFQDGCFAVNRLNTVSPAWLSGSNSSRETNGLYQCWYLQSTSGETGLGPFQEYTRDGKATIMLDTLWSKDMTWCCMRIQGLAPNSNPNTDPAESRVSPIAIKNYYGMECQPVWGGPWQGLSRVSPDPDLGALQTLMDTFYKMPDGMEVKYNFLGTLLPKLATFIPAGMSILKSLFGGAKEKSGETRSPTATGGVSEIAMLMRELLRERSHKQVPSEPRQHQPTAASSKATPRKKKPRRKPVSVVGNKASRRQRR